MPRSWESAVRDVERRAQELYGPGSLREVRGVLHVVSTVESAGRLHVIRIGPRAPASPRDFFVLNLWRAHADAIVTTAEVMRAEPGLSHELQGPQAAELALYREHALGKAAPLRAAILTRSGDIPAGHGMFRARVHNHVLTTPERASGLRAALGTRATVVSLESLDVRRAIDWLRGQGAATIVVEAGPSTAGQLYGPPLAVDHLLLSRCEAEVDPAAVGGALPEPPRLFAELARIGGSRHEEPSGPWRFERYDRAPARY